MIVQKEFLKRLKEDFKLNIYEVKIWTSLLSKGIASAGELADISGVPRSRCYDVLESLEKKGFIIIKIGRPIRYIAVKPEEIIERVKKHIKYEETTNLDILDSIKSTDIFKELELLHKTGIVKVDSETLTDIINGKNNIYSFIKKNAEKVKESLVISTTKEAFEKKMKVMKNILRTLNKKGVNVKIVAPVDMAEYEGMKIINTKLNSRFVIFDNKETLFMLSEKPDQNDMAVWVKSDMFSNALTELLDNHLKK